ncbi:MAG: hypothetical protein KJZ98_16430 [Burkholderiaceae bacterium]|jgi:hypothetical protein|nr:hypothetical protein [Burkholderiaceae bacterium]
MQFKPGDLAIVQNSRWPSNNGRLVLVLDVIPARERDPYVIQPIDGGALIVNGEACDWAYAAPCYLRPLPRIDVDERDELEAVA